MNRESTARFPNRPSLVQLACLLVSRVVPLTVRKRCSVRSGRDEREQCGK